MLPVIILAVIAIPLLVYAFMRVRRRNESGEDLSASGTSKAELEREFAAAEAYEDEWREQQHSERQPPA